MGLLSKFRKSVQPKKVSDLTEADRQDLVTLMTQPGFQVILNIMEQMCEVAETEHFKLNPLHSTPTQIAASQSIARSQRVFFERVQARINWERNEALDTPQPTGDPDLDNPETIERLLDAVR